MEKFVFWLYPSRRFSIDLKQLTIVFGVDIADTLPSLKAKKIPFVNYYSLLPLKDTPLFISFLPETNLHPSKQIEVARKLARMSNSGHHIVLFTHSDYIWIELKNLILAGVLDKPNLIKKYGYKKKEILNYENVAAYIIKGAEEIELKVDEKGIPDNNFEEVLESLSHRLSELETLISKKKPKDLYNEMPTALNGFR